MKRTLIIYNTGETTQEEAEHLLEILNCDDSTLWDNADHCGVEIIEVPFMKTTRHKPSDFVYGMPLETTLQVTIEAAFINLITELGYRENKEWTSDENPQMFKLIDLAEDLRRDIIEELKSQENNTGE